VTASSDSSGADQWIQRVYKAVYPYVNLGLDLSLLSYDIAYLFDKTDNYRPWHTWLNLRIERKGVDEIVGLGYMARIY
jgi:peroxin-12